MLLHFMILAILLLTLMAVYAMRRAEEQVIEGYRLDRRFPDEKKERPIARRSGTEAVM